MWPVWGLVLSLPLFFKHFLKILLIYFFREKVREGKRRRETSACGCFPLGPHWGPDPQPWHVPWLGIKPVTLWFIGLNSVHWATSARAAWPLFITFIKELWLLLLTAVCWRIWDNLQRAGLRVLLWHHLVSCSANSQPLSASQSTQLLHLSCFGANFLFTQRLSSEVGGGGDKLKV